MRELIFASKDWLCNLKARVPRPPAFYTQMDAQLSASFVDAVGASIESFTLLPPRWEDEAVERSKAMQHSMATGERPKPVELATFAIKQNGDAFFIEADLFHIDTSSSIPVRLGWRDLPNGATFRWLDLPAEEIRQDIDDPSLHDEG